jgi:hypothetical protein
MSNHHLVFEYDFPGFSIIRDMRLNTSVTKTIIRPAVVRAMLNASYLVRGLFSNIPCKRPEKFSVPNARTNQLRVKNRVTGWGGGFSGTDASARCRLYLPHLLPLQVSDDQSYNRGSDENGQRNSDSKCGHVEWNLLYPLTHGKVGSGSLG